MNLYHPNQPASEEDDRWIANEVQPHEPALRSYLRSQFPSLDVDDLVQEAYLRLFKAHAAGKTIESIKAYLFSIARNTALTDLRRRGRFSDVPVNELPDWRVLNGEDDAAESASCHERLDLAVEAIDQLPPRCREIFQLAALRRITPAEIALRLGISESTVHVQMARGLKKCAEYLRRRGE